MYFKINVSLSVLSVLKVNFLMMILRYLIDAYSTFYDDINIKTLIENYLKRSHDEFKSHPIKSNHIE